MPLVGLFEEIARAEPGRAAILGIGGAPDLSYGALRRWSGGVAAALGARGVGRGDFVGVRLARSAEAVAAILGILRAGAAYVPIDPAYPAERQAFMLADSGARAVIGRGGAVDAGALPAGCAWVDIDGVGEAEPGPGRAEAPEDRLNLLYTSGSTGRPKGVIGGRGAMLNRLAWGWSALPFQPGERVAHRSSLNFVDAGPEIFSGLLRGVPTVIVPPEAHADLGALARAVREGGATRITVVPSLLAALLRALPDPEALLGGVRCWITSGEALRRPLLEQFRAALPGATLVNLYGTTEVTGDVTAAIFRPGEPIPAGDPPIGAAMAGAILRALDEEGREVAPGEAGELYVGGPVLAEGYHQRPREQEIRFLALPGIGRAFRTGDRARALPGGAWAYLGRADTAVKIRGIRVDLEEIERALLPGCPSARDIAAVLEEAGAEGRGVVAVAAPAGGGEGEAGEDRGGEAGREQAIRDEIGRAAAALPEVMRPRRVVIAPIPLLPNGKRDRRALAGLAVAAARAIPAADRPQGEAEVRLAALWAGALQRDPGSIGRHDRFLEIGGDSLAAAELAAGVEAAFGAGRAEIGRGGTLAEIAAALAGGADLAGVARERIWLTELAAGAADPAVIEMVAEASRDAEVLANTDLPPRMGPGEAAAWCAAQAGVVIWAGGAPVGAGVAQPCRYAGEGVEVPPGAGQLEEWLRPSARGRDLLVAAWPALAAWLSKRYRCEVSAVWADHRAMIGVLAARGYRRIGAAHWVHPSGQGPDGPCEVWIAELPV